MNVVGKVCVPNQIKIISSLLFAKYTEKKRKNKHNHHLKKVKLNVEYWLVLATMVIRDVPATDSILEIKLPIPDMPEGRNQKKHGSNPSKMENVKPGFVMPLPVVTI